MKFRPAWFRPTFQKFAGTDCGSVQLHVTDRSTFQPVRTSLALLAAMREVSGDKFKWRTEVYEFVTDPIAMALLFGSTANANTSNPASRSRNWTPRGKKRRSPSRTGSIRCCCMIEKVAHRSGRAAILDCLLAFIQ